MQPAAAKKQLHVFRSLLATLKDKSFRILSGLTVLTLSGWTFATSIIVFINVSHVFPGDLKASSILIGSMGMAQTAVVVVTLVLALAPCRVGGDWFPFAARRKHRPYDFRLVTPSLGFVGRDAGDEVFLEFR